MTKPYPVKSDIKASTKQLVMVLKILLGDKGGKK
jgi:hypothetical protein